jgi:hypothetical protein
MSENVGTSTSLNPKGLHGLYKENYTLPKEPKRMSTTFDISELISYHTRPERLTVITKEGLS